jgi:SagB-type dehydrogenase family enzyme
LELPKPKPDSDVSLEEAISKRRSVRKFTSEPVSLEKLSQILWAAQGQTEGRYRAAPSAGALYPIELVVVMESGVYRYVPEGHRLEKLASTDVRSKLSEAALGQRFIKEAPVVIVITAVFERVMSKYGVRGERYAFIEAGHIAQNVCLQAVALGLSTVVTGAFNDSGVQSVLEIPGDFKPLCILPIGYKE